MNTGIDLLSLVLVLEPAVAHDPGKALPRWWGRAAHALLLDILSQSDPGLSESLHSQSGIRQFTTSSLLGRFPNRGFDRDQPYALRMTAMENTVAGILLKAAQDGPLSPGSTLELDYFPFQVKKVFWRSDDHPWAGIGTYDELSATTLLAQEKPPKRLTLQFTSPTAFKSSGMHLPVPLPGLVFGSLLERWNAFAPLAFPEEARQYAAECLAISRYKLSTRAVALKAGGLRVGAVGKISYTSLNYDRYWMSIMATLAEFALFSGTGVGTTMGMGQCKKM